MSKDKIIIKASDYRYPSREELREVYSRTPDLPNFGYVSESPITSILRDKRSLTEVHRDDNLQYWNHILLNKNGALAHSFNLAMVNFARGIPDHVEQFERIHYINRIQFDYYAEAFYYHFATVKDTIAQLLNIYFFLGLEVNKIHFNDRFVKTLSSIDVRIAINTFFDQTTLASEYRNSFAHRTPVHTPDSRSSIKMEDGKVTYGSASYHHVKTSEISGNLETTLHATVDLINQLRPIMLQ